MKPLIQNQFQLHFIFQKLIRVKNDRVEPVWLQNLFLSDCLVRISYPMADDQNPTLSRQTLPLSPSLTHKLFHTMLSLSFPLTYTYAHPLTLSYTSSQGATQPQLTIRQVAVGAPVKLSVLTRSIFSL